MADYRVSAAGLDALSTVLTKKLKQYISDRAPLEVKWMQNLLQYRGIYDKEVLDRIGSRRSKAYPRDTRTKIKAHVAKMLEMMFPAAEENWDLVISPFPSLPTKDTEAVIRALQEQKREAGDMEARLTDTEIEEGIRVLAEERRYRMRTKIKDQLFDEETNWVRVAKRALRSGAIYGIGVVRAPLVRTKSQRTWVYDEVSMTYSAEQVTEDIPYLEYSRLWDLYFDLSADTWAEQEGIFERTVFSRATLGELRDRPGFDRDTITEYMREHPTGNYTVRGFETLLNNLSDSSAPEASKKANRFEVFRWYGFCDADVLLAAGVDIAEEQRGEAVLAEVWMLGNKLIFADLAPFGSKVADVYHAYVYAEDEEAGLTGISMADELRDRQMSICAATRALYDNMGVTCGPMFEVAVDLLKPNSEPKDIHGFKIFEREGDGPELQYPAVRPIVSDSRIPELLNILAGERQQFDNESGLPSWMQGNAQPLGEAFRTSMNMSQMAGGANLPTKDNARNFDTFTASVVRSFLDWNMEFLSDESIKGDFAVQAKGTISLVAKEIRGAALDQFMGTLTEEERAMFKQRETLVERMKSRDLPIELIYGEDESAQILERIRQQKEQMQRVSQGAEETKTRKVAAEAALKETQAQKLADMSELEATEMLTKIYSLMASAKAKEDKGQVDIMSAMTNQLAAQGGGNG